MKRALTLQIAKTFSKFLHIQTIYNIFATLNQKVYHFGYRPRQSHDRRKTPARMAESVDALVSNTSGAIRAGSIPAPGTEAEF